MRKLIVAIIAFVLLLGGYIVYMEIDKRKFIDNISAVSEVVNQPVNVTETTRDAIQENKKPKFQEVDLDKILDAVNRIPETFGHSEASTTYAKLQTKRMSGEKLTLDENVARLEAQLYLWPNEYTRRSLILQKWKQSKGPSYDRSNGFSDEDIAELRELGIPVVRRGTTTMINRPPDSVLKRLAEEDAKEYGHILRQFIDHEESPPSAPAPDTVFSEYIGEDTDFLQARSEEIPITPESQVSGTPEHIHQEDGYVHETPTSPSPSPPTAAKSVEYSGREGLSRVQQELVKQFFDEYGTEEGLRQLRKMDPDTAERFERERQPSEPSRDAPSDDDYSDAQPPDDSP